MPKAILIPVDVKVPAKVVHIVEYDHDMPGAQCKQLQDLVGGNIEIVPLTDTAHGYINEEGKLEGLAFNKRATVLALSLGSIFPDDHIVGPMVILGTGPDGYEYDAPKGMIDSVLSHAEG